MIEKTNNSHSNINLTENELLIINNSLNEILNNILVTDYIDKTGTSEESTLKILRIFSSAIDSIEKLNKEVPDEYRSEEEIVLELLKKNNHEISNSVSLLNLSKTHAEFQMSIAGLMVLLNVLNVVYREIDDWEFVARIGKKKSEALILINNINNIIGGVDIPGNRELK